MERAVKEQRIQKKYEEDFKRQAVEMSSTAGTLLAQRVSVSAY